jgi:multidrug efflux pump subunit AcrB
LVINPALASLFMKSTKKARQASKSKAADELAWEKPIAVKGVILRSYAAALRFSLRHPLALVLGTALLVVMMVQGWLLAVGLRKPVEFFPSADPRGIYVNVDFPEGADLNYIDGILKQVEAAVAEGGRRGEKSFAPTEYDKALAPKQHRKADGAVFTGPSDLANISIIYTKAVSSSTGSSAFEQNSPSHVGVRFVDLADRFESSSDTVEKIRRRVADIAGAKITVALEADGPPTGAPVNIEIAGENFAVLGTVAREVKKALAQLPHVEDIRDNFVEGTPSVRIKVDRQKAALFGLSTGSIGFALKAAYNGLVVSSFRDGNDDWDITVQLPEKDRQVTDVLRELMLTVPDGTAVPLSTLATVEITGSMGNITRINNARTVTVKANVDENKIPAAVVRQQAEKLLAQMPLPPGYKVSFTGENQDQQESEAFLGKAFAVALLLIFLVIVTQFNSVSQPFLIMSSVVLSMGGVFFGLMLWKMPFGIIMTGIGVISLAGVAVNNAIVLIDYTNQLRKRGIPLKEAVVAAGATRLRPVFLTAITTILGLVPMITGASYDFTKMSMSWVSESSQFWQSMAVVVSSGLLVATFLTLVVVPTLYFLLERSKEGLAEGWMWWERRRAGVYRVLAGE